MPLITLQTSVSLAEDKRQELLASLSRILTESIGKPEQYVMATIDTVAMIMSGKAGGAAYAEVRSIGGLNAKVNTQIARKLCALLEESLGIPPNRTYIHFMEVDASDWGWNGGTFG